MGFLPDKPIVIRSNFFTKAISWFIDVYAITLYPFVIMRESEEHANMSPGNRLWEQYKEQKTIHHETIHIQQYKELWIVGFLALYLWDWCVGMVKYRNPQKAYYQIRFEQEAYDHDKEFCFYFDGVRRAGSQYWQGEEDYVDTREPHAWKKYKV